MTDVADLPAARAAVEKVLQSLKSAMGADGGGVSLVSMEDHRIRLKLLGACRFCPSQPLTIAQTLLPSIQSAVSDDWRIEFE